jgi:hypothetical protein
MQAVKMQAAVIGEDKIIHARLILQKKKKKSAIDESLWALTVAVYKRFVSFPFNYVAPWAVICSTSFFASRARKVPAVIRLANLCVRLAAAAFVLNGQGADPSRSLVTDNVFSHSELFAIFGDSSPHARLWSAQCVQPFWRCNHWRPNLTIVVETLHSPRSLTVSSLAPPPFPAAPPSVLAACSLASPALD